ncbi:hypothetical protein [Galactobacter valiniphilus]|uniref:hypothetical protein n=1 Tax=Galactobacter valiniphilus TaxID=2676122 RepID=UPI0037351CF1
MSPLTSSRRRLVAGLVVLACAVLTLAVTVALGAQRGARIDDPHAAHSAGQAEAARPSLGAIGPSAAVPGTPGGATPSPGSATPSPTPSPGTGLSASPSSGADAGELDARPLRAGATALPPASSSPPPAVVRGGEGTTLDGAASRSGDAAPLRADGTRERSLKPAPKVAPEDVLGSERGTGGCLKEYGQTGQCLPPVPPSQAEHVSQMLAAGQDPSAMTHPYRCTEVRTMFATGLIVRVSGVDPQGLDRNGDGVACGRGDGDA